VFRYPKDESLDYIKRVVGLPGDTVVYENKQLTVNGKPVPKRPAGAFMAEGSRPSSRFQETLGDKTYFTLNDDGAPAVAELLHENHVAHSKRGDHGARGNIEGLKQE
ncbi:MAG: signal peptidase I, partial [Betaproteobacteria bacterium]|nr:signal peptidase I [Betaproteobacteria bacterium]